ncbi:patatin-like phospholipase (plasmid) [Frigidibacter mobilis]|uniref:Patatin-like phospholipase n=1 Tax=Frigidibacter mobilis TaxID=1335048 RepID=A0A159Z9P0_9RHOB|nr:patatin-like phospholipase [Frigidibacter mobilis]
MLAECERRFLKGGSAASYFDMVAGTSTGGIIALGMAAGMRAEEVLEIYMRHGSEIFPQPWTPPTRFGRAMCRFRGYPAGHSDLKPASIPE